MRFTLSKRVPERDNPFADRNSPRESTILELVKFGLGQSSFEIVGQDEGAVHVCILTPGSRRMLV